MFVLFYHTLYRTSFLNRDYLGHRCC